MTPRGESSYTAVLSPLGVKNLRNYRMKSKYIEEKNYRPSNVSLRSAKDIDSFIREIKEESLLKKFTVVDGNLVIFGVEGPIFYKRNKFWLISAELHGGVWDKHYIILFPQLKELILRGHSFLRLDSGCLSGMVLGDTTCDCLEQLRKAQDIAAEKGGVIVHIPAHDGRGWQDYKMANQRIMHETNLDTITTAKKFYGDESKIDQRTFDEAAIILRALGFPTGYKFDLGTQNPQKIKALLNVGFDLSSIKELNVNAKSKLLKMNLGAKHQFFNRMKEVSLHESH